MHVCGLLADRAVRCDVEDLAVDHRSGRGAGAGEVDAAVPVGRKVVGADEGISVLVVRVGSEILALGRDASDRAAVVAGREKLPLGGSNDRGGSTACLRPEYGVL